MSQLLDKLNAYVPATLWTLAPKHILMQGAGLLATGDIVDLYWSGDTRLVVQFPQRLGLVEHRLQMNGERIEGHCDCSVSQPCQHFLGSMMLVMHLLKDFAAFGRLPNRVLADKLRNKLLRDATHPAVPRPASPNQPATAKPGLPISERHVLIRPAAANLFTYRDSLSPRAQDAYATLPNDLRGFVGHWSTGKAAEDAFWKWFVNPIRRLPALIEIGTEKHNVHPGPAEGWAGAAVLDIEGKTLHLRRLLSHDGQPVEQPFVPVGSDMVFLVEDKQLIRLTTLAGWRQWDMVLQSVRESMWQHLGYADPHFTTQHLAGDRDVKLPMRLINRAELSWWGDDKLMRLTMPALHWKGQPVAEPTLAQPSGHIALMPSRSPGFLIARVHCEVGTHRFNGIVQGLIESDEVMDRSEVDGTLFTAKSRREAIMATLHACWLEPDAKVQRELLAALSSAPSFRTPAQAKSAVRAVKKLLKSHEEISHSEALHASARDGWQRIAGILGTARTAVALARWTLGADVQEKVAGVKDQYGIDEEDDEDFEDDGDGDGFGDDDYATDLREEADLRLYIPTAEALPRLPTLVAACQQHGVRLTYSQQPIEVTSLSCSATASQSESKGLDWFEVKPEVICNGSLIPQQQWEDLLSRGHLVDEKGQMKVIDVKSLDSLKRLTSILGTQRRESRAETEEKKRQALDELVKIPRLRILDWLMLARHGIDMTMPEGERAVLESLMSFETLQRAPLPEMKATLRDYQIAGYSWLAFLYQHGFGGCLADDMGLGKTIQTITLLAAIKEGLVKPLASDGGESRPHLLVVPPTLLFNWEHEVRTFCPGLKVYEYTGKGRSLIGITDGIVITTYELARRDIETLRDFKFDVIIFDEAQQVKNLLGERSRAMRQLDGRMKLTLTGTPLENHIGEYYSIIDLAVPGLFGDYRHFMDAIKQPNGHFNPLDRAKPFVLRRTKDKILKELPPKQESDMHLDLSEEQKRFYTRTVGEVKQEVLAAFADKGAQQAGIVALAALTRLRQVCVSPALIDPTHRELSPKLTHLCDKLEELRAEGHCALVFSQFTKALDLLEAQLKTTALDYQRLDGSTPQQKRKTLVEAFQKPDGPGIFLISLKAGGAGLNLTRASYVFHLDPWWNPAAENQASDRAHRMGQKNTVFIQRLLMRHTVEEKIMLLKAQKSELFDRVLSGAEGERSSGGAIITKDDFKFLLE